jgi:undecaprenol kinase
MALKDNKQIDKNKNFIVALYHAINGLIAIYKTERNFRFHILLSVIVILSSLLLKLTLHDWLWVALAIFSVLLSEIINTLCESIVDLVVGNHYNELAKRIKDIAAGGVVLSSIFATAIGALIYLPIILSFLIGGH